MSRRVEFLMEIVADARREMAEAKEQLDEAAGRHYVYGIELVSAMQAEGVESVEYDGVTFHLGGDGEPERWENDPLEGVDLDD